MQETNLHTWLRHYWLLWIPPAAAVLGLIGYRQLLAVEQFIANYILFCPLYKLTGIYCPGCGGTRSLTALLHGDLLLAVHENPAVPVLLLVVLLVYIEQCMKLFDKKQHLFPRNLVFWGIGFGLLVIWDIFRNFVPELMPIS